MNALEMSRRYFFEFAEPLLKSDFPFLYPRLAAGLVGNGSECFGYDDEISRDHDWGIDFFLWVTADDRAQIPDLIDWKKALIEKHPPEYARSRSEYGARIGVMTIGDFYKSLIGYSSGPAELLDWLKIPEENFAMVVNGAVFIDHAGEFTAIRCRLLRHYPEDIFKKKLSAKCMAIAQTGQYNLSRCYKRQDWVTYKTVLSRFGDSVIGAVFLLNRTYRPYYKWSFKRMSELPILGGQISPLLTDIAVTCGIDAQSHQLIENDIDAICALIIKEIKKQQLASSDDWFLTTQGEEIRRGIHDEFLRSLPAQYE